MATTHGAFVYGTLMYRPILLKLLSRIPENSNAYIKGYRRRALKGYVYPAIVPSPVSEVQGLFLQGLSDMEMEILDAYEGIEYYKQNVQVYSPNKEPKAAIAYVWKEEYSHLIDKTKDDWDQEAFEQHHLETFCRDILLE